MPYDPFDDEKKQFTLKEFITTAKEELDNYEKEWSGPDTNAYHKDKHTWDEWFQTFHRFMSW